MRTEAGMEMGTMNVSSLIKYLGKHAEINEQAFKDD